MTSCHVTKLEIVEGEFESSFRFRWEGPDWNDALAAVKTQIPPDARSYDPASTRWTVATAFEDELAGIFENFASSLDAIRSQMGMGF